jgi:hypothetical protein
MAKYEELLDPAQVKELAKRIKSAKLTDEELEKTLAGYLGTTVEDIKDGTSEVPDDVIDRLVDELEDLLSPKTAPTPEPTEPSADTEAKFGITDEEINRLVTERREAVKAAQRARRTELIDEAKAVAKRATGKDLDEKEVRAIRIPKDEASKIAADTKAGWAAGRGSALTGELLAELDRREAEQLRAESAARGKTD